MVFYVLFESAVGFALFELKEFDETSATEASVQKQVAKFQTFSKIAHLKAYFPFEAASITLNNAFKVAQGKVTQELTGFLSQNLPLTKKKEKVILGVNDNKLAGAISQALGIQTLASKVVLELIRGFRAHFIKFLKNPDVDDSVLSTAQLGLGHAFSRNKISLDVNREDKPIIQSISLLQLLDKDVNTLSMRIREWFSWHFPQLSKLISDNNVFVKLAHLIKNRDNIESITAAELEEIVSDGEIAERILELANNSMGQEMSQFDTKCLDELCVQALHLYDFRTQMQGYLKDKMENVAPNLTTLVGESVGAKLISHSGSLSNLAKYPASTVQILGAEKALFRALKTKTNTPKYGLLYHSSFIGRAIGKNKGKISRFLANKCSIAARLDNFLVQPTNRFGDRLKEQVETRMKYLDQGGEIETNEDIMDEIMQELKEENLYFDSEKQLKSFKKKEKRGKKVAMEEEQVVDKKPKKAKKVMEVQEQVQQDKPTKKNRKASETSKVEEPKKKKVKA